MDVRKTPEGYKLILVGGDTNETCTELDKIKLQYKSIYLIVALRNALTGYPNIMWAKFCEEAGQVCSAFTTSSCERAIKDWWREFKINDCFAYPRGPNGHFKKSKERLPPFLADDEDLLKKLLVTDLILKDLSIDNAKEYVVKNLPQWDIHLPLTIRQSTEKNCYCGCMDSLRIHQGPAFGSG
jgi:hypothetical protein